MKKFGFLSGILCFFVFFAAPGNLFARGWEDGDVNGSYSVGIYNQYVHEWSGELLDDRPSIRGEVTFDLPHNLYVSIWSAVHFGDITYLNGNEIDFSFGWVGEVNELLLEPKISYLNFVPLFDGREGNIIEPSIKISKNYDCDKWQIKPFGWIAVDIPDGEDQEFDFEWDKYFSVGAENTMTFSENLSICLTPCVTYMAPAYDMESTLTFLQSIKVFYRMDDGYIIYPSFLLSCPIWDDTGKELDKSFGISVSGEF